MAVWEQDVQHRDDDNDVGLDYEHEEGFKFWVLIAGHTRSTRWYTNTLWESWLHQHCQAPPFSIGYFSKKFPVIGQHMRYLRLQELSKSSENWPDKFDVEIEACFDVQNFDVPLSTDTNFSSRSLKVFSTRSPYAVSSNSETSKFRTSKNVWTSKSIIMFNSRSFFKIF